jgi:glycosyltransferase involved in cell wall biosynthesis
VQSYCVAVEPRVTVFIPTYNRAHLLPRAIESVLAQTYPDFRLEISDNASTDETPEIVARYQDPRIAFIRQPENLGLLGNHNQFLERVRTEYSLILPDDDLVYPELLENAVRTLDEQPEVGTVHAKFDVIGPDDEVLLRNVDWTYGLSGDTVETAEEFIAESMKWSCRVCASTALMRTAALPQGGMSAADFPAVDFGMWLRMGGAGWKFAFLGKTLGAYRIHGETHSARFGPPQGPGYVQGVEIVSQLKGVKLRFIDTHDGELADPAKLRRLAEHSRRRELVVMARNTTLPERRPLPTFRALLEATRADPGVLLEPAAWRLAGASLLGPGVVERLRRHQEDGRPGR